MEELKKLLLAAGFPAATLDVLTAEEKPEDYDEEKIIKDAVAERQQFYATKATPEIEKAYEERVKTERYAATVKPITNRLERTAKQLGATAEELKDLDAKGIAELIATKHEEAVAAASKTNDDELRKQVNDLKAKWSESQEALQTALSEKDAEIAKVRAESEAERKAEKVNGFFLAGITGDKFKDAKDIDLAPYMEVQMRKFGYGIDLDEEGKPKPVMLKDGTDAINIAGTAKYDSYEDMLLDVARAAKVFPTHNGGEGKTLGNEMVINGEKKVIGGNVNFLKEAMGV